MTMTRTIGGDRLGSGKKMTVDMKTYERSTHDLGYIWRSTMAAGTLVPFMTELGLPGDTFDIDLDCNIMTHPTIGPLFGSYKVQLDVFMTPIRLYQAQLHNNAIGIGLNMANVLLPQLLVQAEPFDGNGGDNQQINPSCLLSYLNIRGIGRGTTDTVEREFNAVPYLAYWDIYKNYYANKQEEAGAYVHSTQQPTQTNITGVTVQYIGSGAPGGVPLPELPTVSYDLPKLTTADNPWIDFAYPSSESPTGRQTLYLQVHIADGPAEQIAVMDLFHTVDTGSISGVIRAQYLKTNEDVQIIGWRYATADEIQASPPQVMTFPLTSIDQIRNEILQHSLPSVPYLIDATKPHPYGAILGHTGTEAAGNRVWAKMSSQEGLALKTYQSDLFNNWISTEWLDGTNGINEITSIDTTSGSFSIDTLNLSRKVYDMLNRIAISGGTYDDWLDTVYTHDKYRQCSTPMYMGGLIKELVFQEVVSNSESVDQPLGTLAGKGTMSKKHKGGKITVKVDEPSYIMGIISLTPRVDYSQGNKWDVNLKSMDDLHKPALDEIGFQDLITDQMAWWDTEIDGITGVNFKSAGKQPAWLNYMTNVNQIRGNFAIEGNEMFMTLNRQYEYNPSTLGIKDLTTYIDPAKFNNIFAQTSRDAQNFWTQIGVDITARRKMSARIIPNL